MGDVIHLRAALDAKEEDAFRAYASALLLAQATGRLRDIAAAVRAYEAWLCIAIPDEAQRRRVWP